MGEMTKIEWTTHTFNPWRGCTHVSAGCANCYAETWSKRNPAVLGQWGKHGTRVVAAEGAWQEPLRWDRAAQKAGERRRVFCASLADVFEDWDGPMMDAKGNVLDSDRSRRMTASLASSYDPLSMNDVRRRLFDLIDRTPNLDWLVLTKRPENIARLLPEYVETRPSKNAFFGEEARRRGLENGRAYDSTVSVSGIGIYRKNLWLGTSVEDQDAVKRIDHLMKVPAAIHFLSVEPLLGPVDLFLDAGRESGGPQGWIPDLKPDWVIVGGESGHGARPCHLSWIRSIMRQCQEAGVACFVKQLGAVIHTDDPADMAYDRRVRLGAMIAPQEPPATAFGLKLQDSKGGDPGEWPKDLRFRRFPIVETMP